jgi:hypothetical protein
VLGLGFFPAPVLDVTSASIDAVVERVHPAPAASPSAPVALTVAPARPARSSSKSPD